MTVSRITSLSIGNDMLISSVSLNEFLKEQQSDVELKPVFQYLKNSSRVNMEKLGQFKRCRQYLHVSNTGHLMWKDKFVVPSLLKAKILDASHNNSMSGHFGEKRTLRKFSEKFHWPKCVKRCTQLGS